MTTKVDKVENVLKKRAALSLRKLVDRQGISVDLIKTEDYTDTYDDVYGMLSGKSTDIVIKSTNEVFSFTNTVDDVLTMAIDGGNVRSVTFGSGVKTLSEVISAVNAVFPGLAVLDGTGKLRLEASTSIDIKASSTSLSVIGLTAGVISNETRIDVMITGDEFTPFDGFNIGRLVEGFLYDPSLTAEAGDIVNVVREGNRIRQFKLTEHDALGSTRNIINRFRISAVLD